MMEVTARANPMERRRSASSRMSSSTRFSTMTFDRVMTSLRRPGVPMRTREPVCGRRKSEQRADGGERPVRLAH